MAFDIKGFYDRLDQYYAGYDNAATEQFLKDSLAEAESFMIVPSHCCCCDDHMDHTPEEQVESMSDEERQWILEWPSSTRWPASTAASASSTSA